MDALIIAAGYGSRLRDLSDSKPLTPILGKPLIELGVRQAARAGAGKVVVVTGHEAERVEGFLSQLSDSSGIVIEPVRIDDWSTPNGYSVMAGAQQISGDYLLMMADHIFEAAILQKLAQQGDPARGVTLAIDRRRVVSELVDPDDATWVSTAPDGLIRAIGKTISPYDAVDCGAFLATPELTEAIAGAIREGASGSLSDGMQRLANAGRAGTMDVGTDWWMDVDEPCFHAMAEELAPQYLPEIFS